MDITYKVVLVYIDTNNNLIAIPTGESQKYGLRGLDIVSQLFSPYSDEQLELFLLDSLAKCYSQMVDDSIDTSSLEKFLNVKGAAKAEKNRKLVNFEWFKISGYSVMPTNKISKRGFVHIEDKKIELGFVLKEGDLAGAFRKSMQLSTP